MWGVRARAIPDTDGMQTVQGHYKGSRNELFCRGLLSTVINPYASALEIWIRRICGAWNDEAK